MKKLILGAVLLFATVSLFAQPQWLSDWKQFTASYVYDGKYIADQKLYSNYVNSVDVDKEGGVWFAVQGQIRLYYDGKMATMKPKDFGNPRRVNLLKIDNESNIWVATNKGLYKYDGTQFTYMNVPEIELVTEIAISPENNIWVSGYSSDAINAKGGGVSVYDGSKWVNYNTENSGLPKRFVEDITFDKEGNVWMVAGIQDYGVVKFDGSNWTHFHKDNSGLPSNTVRAIEFDNTGKGWFGTPKGLVSFDGSDWKNHSMRDLMANVSFGLFEKSLPEPDLLSLAVDQNNMIWIGTDGNGVLAYDGESVKIINKENSPLTTNYVRNIIVDNQNRKFFLTGVFPETWLDRFFGDKEVSPEKFGGVVMYNEPRFDHFPEWEIHNRFTSNIPTSYVNQMMFDPSDKLWMATSGSGVMSYDGNNWKLYRDPKTGVVGEMLQRISVSNNGDVFAGAQLKGLYKVEGDELKAISKDDFGYKNKNINGLAVSGNNKVFIATIMGLDICELDGGCEFYDKKTGLLSNNLFFCKMDSKGDVWVGTTKGICVYRDGNWTCWDKKIGGLAGYVYDMDEDSKGNVWAISSKGLYKLEGDMFKIYEASGDAPKYFLANCMTITPDDKIWIGTEKHGLICFDGQSTWKQYNKENSGVYFDRVEDVVSDSKGGLWISAKWIAPKTVPDYTSASAATPDPGAPIKKLIEDFDPKGALIYYQPK
jgi:ligand-binding sensor domain-containing protein